MTQKAKRRICRDRQCAGADREWGTLHADEIDHQRHCEDRSATADEPEDEADERSRKCSKQILDRLEDHSSAAFSSSFGLSAFRS